jgi:hypothetical protein
MESLKQIFVYRPSWFEGAKRDIVTQMGRCAGGVIDTPDALAKLPDDDIPLVCCAAELGQLVREWKARGRQFMYWDRGYVRRLGGLFPPLDQTDGYYRLHLNVFQMNRIQEESSARWDALNVSLSPWRDVGCDIIVATTNSQYWSFHSVPGGERAWLEQTMEALRRSTRHRIVIRRKTDQTPLSRALANAHCLVSHGSNSAVEAVILGCPVIVDPISAATSVGLTDPSQAKNVIRPDRARWCYALAHSQFTRREMTDGSAFRAVLQEPRPTIMAA